MIPKVIHYCWFGGKPLPDSAVNCINSWKMFFPDYQIKEWNEKNFDVNSIPYTRDAYAVKKYAFVSDYARFWILYHYGGIYFDTDVEVLRPMNDIVARGNFMGREKGAYMRNIGLGEGNGYAVNPGLGFGMAKGNNILCEILENYDKFTFIQSDGSLNLKTIVFYTSEILYQHGLSHNSDDPELVEDIWIYPCDVFCPMDHTRGNYVKITERTRTIHLYDATWRDHTTVHYHLAKIKKWIIRTYLTVKGE